MPPLVATAAGVDGGGPGSSEHRAGQPGVYADSAASKAGDPIAPVDPPDTIYANSMYEPGSGRGQNFGANYNYTPKTVGTAKPGQPQMPATVSTAAQPATIAPTTSGVGKPPQPATPPIAGSNDGPGAGPGAGAGVVKAPSPNGGLGSGASGLKAQNT